MVKMPSTAGPTVSVVLPTYNAGRFIGETIRSVLAQSHDDFEFLIFDNASEDDTQAIVRSFADPRILYHRNPVNLGFHGNVNLAIASARGAYVAVMNADDLWERHFLSQTVGFLDRHPQAAFVHTRAIWIDENGTPYGGSEDGWLPLSEPRQAFLACLSHGFCFASMLMRRIHLERAGPIPQNEPWKQIADSWLFLKLALIGPVGYIDEPLVRYRVHLNSMSFDMYANGSFFRRSLAGIQDAFTWPEAVALDLGGHERAARESIALTNIRILPIIRTRAPALQFLKVWVSIVRSVPSVIRYPSVWGRLAFGLLPVGVIAAFRELRQRRWQIRNRTGEIEYDAGGTS